MRRLVSVPAHVVSLFGAYLLGASPVLGEVITSQGGRDFLLYETSGQLFGAVCAPGQVIHNHASCSDLSAPLGEGAGRAGLTATCRATAETAQKQLADVYAEVAGVDQQLAALMNATPPSDPSTTIKQEINALETKLATAEALIADLADQVAQIDQSLQDSTTGPDPALQAQEAALRAKQAQATSDAAALVAQMSTLQQQLIDAGSGIVDEDTFKDLQATRASYVQTSTTLAAKSAQAIQDCVNAERLLGYVMDAVNPYDMSDATAGSGAFATVRPIAEQLLTALEAVPKVVTNSQRQDTQTTDAGTLAWTEDCTAPAPGASGQVVGTNLVSLDCILYVEPGTYCRDVTVRFDGATPGPAVDVAINRTGGGVSNPNLQFTVDATTPGVQPLLAVNGCGKWQVISDFSCSPSPTTTGIITEPNGLMCRITMADTLKTVWP